MHAVSPRDAAQIFRRAIDAPPSLHFAIVPGISEHAVAFQDNTNTKEVLVRLCALVAEVSLTLLLLADILLIFSRGLLTFCSHLCACFAQGYLPQDGTAIAHPKL